MKTYSLSFCDFEYHDDILETIVHDGIEINETMAKEYLSFVESIEPKVSKILINRINKYSYTFKANLVLAKSNSPKDIAVVKYGRLPWPLKGIFSPKFYHLAFFNDRDEAINWLRSK